jgi:hypothetical protein
VLRITTFCICIYVFGCRLSLFRLCDTDFGIIPVAEIAIGTTYFYYYYYYYYYVVSCHRPFLPGTSLKSAVIPTAEVSSFRLQYFP